VLVRRSGGGALQVCAGKLIVCAQRIPSVHRRRSTSHIDGKSNGLGNLRPAGSMLMGHLRLRLTRARD